MLSFRLLSLGLALLGHDDGQEDVEEEQAKHDVDAQVVDRLDRGQGLVQLEQIKGHRRKVQGTGRQQPSHNAPGSLGHHMGDAGLARNERVNRASEADGQAALGLHVHELEAEAEEVAHVSAVPDGQEEKDTESGQVLVAEEAQALEDVELGPEVGVHVEGGDNLGQGGGELVVEWVDVAEAVPLGLALGVVAVEGDAREDTGALSDGPDSKVLSKSKKKTISHDEE